jgi:hypothetical protein
MVFAGPVFTEWYWGPLFFGVLFGPAGFDAEVVRAYDHLDPVLIFVYDAGRAGYAQGSEQRASVVELAPGRCSLTRLAGTGTNFFEGPCEERLTAAGRHVFVARSPPLARGREALAVLDGTLVRLQSTGVPERDVLRWFDALRPVQPGAIDFKGP